MTIIRSLPSNRGLLASLAIFSALLISSPGFGQELSGDETTVTGTVVSASRNTMTVRNERGQYQLFVFDRETTKPSSLPAGARVRVLSWAGDDPSVRFARDVTIVTQGAASREADRTVAEVSPVVPREVRSLERDIERAARRFQVGVRGGVALDPELVLIGVQSQIGPFFNSNVFLRPNVEFAYGEVTALFGLNLEAVYRLPINTRQGRWSAYVGGGPGFNLIHQSFDSNTGERNIDFDDFRSDTGLNILGGIQFRRGTFVELKTTVYSTPAPTLRLLFGYNF
jgi:hypothetical protein